MIILSPEVARTLAGASGAPALRLSVKGSLGIGAGGIVIAGGDSDGELRRGDYGVDPSA